MPNFATVMKRILTTLLLCSAVFPLFAQKFLHEEYLDYFFENNEFDAGAEKYMESETFHSILLMPQVGISYKQSRVTEHRILAGVTVLRDMGSGEKLGDSFKELSIYYQVAHKLGGQRVFRAVAGVIPRYLLDGKYSQAIWSDEINFYDANLEGALLQYGARDFEAELGCDWMGKKGIGVRERFQVFSSGKWNVNKWLSAGWGLSFYHYATSDVAHNVIDNHLFNPWIKADFACLGHAFQELSVQAGLMAGYQRSRDIDPDPVMPFGTEIIFRAKKWNVCLQNSIYAGEDLYHYYDSPAPEGGVYASDLYLGEPTYRGFYDMAELLWTPHISKRLRLQIGAAFHFDSEGYQGCQQVVRLRTSF